jgi:hypothetical protein
MKSYNSDYKKLIKTLNKLKLDKNKNKYYWACFPISDTKLLIKKIVKK